MTDEFWTRPELAHVHTFARSRLVCPWATLGVTLVRAACSIPPHVNIPPITGGSVAPNLFCNLVGPSGMGKDSAKAASLDAVKFVDYWGVESDVPDLPVGTGEGIAKTFNQDTGKSSDEDDEDGDDGEDAIHTAIFSSSEVERLASLSARSGSTIESVIRQVYNGESIGFTNAGKHTRTNVPRLSYRAGLIFGVQPLKAGWLLAGEDGGTPQRFTWMPVQDHAVPDEPPAEPEAPWKVTIPTWPSTPSTISVPKFIWLLVQDNRRAQHRGEVDALDGHALLNRLKIAVALMALAGRTEVTREDWTLAATIMAVSNQTREDCVRAAAELAHKATLARAAARLTTETYIDNSKHRRAKDRILEQLSKLTTGEIITRHDSRRKLRLELREYWEPAMAELVDHGVSSEVKTERGTGYTRGHGYDVYTAADQRQDGVYGPYPCTPNNGDAPGQMADPDSQAPQELDHGANNGRHHNGYADTCPLCNELKPLRPAGSPGAGVCESCAVNQMRLPPSNRVEAEF